MIKKTITNRGSFTELLFNEDRSKIASLSASFHPNNSGALFARNTGTASVNVLLKTTDENDVEVIVLDERIGLATYHNDAMKQARVYIRENKLRDMLKKEAVALGII